MKKKYLSLGLVLGLTFSSGLAGLVSCKTSENDKPTVPEVVVRSYLSVDSSDTRVNYVEGETFDPSGLVVTKITETDGIKIDESILADGTYTLSIPAGTALKTTDTEVVVSVKEANVQPGSFKIRVAEKLPTVLERLQSLQESTGYKAIMTGDVTTRSVVFDENGQPGYKLVTHDLEKTFEFSPIGWTSSYSFVDLEGVSNEIYSYLINLGTKDNPGGVAAYETSQVDGELYGIGAIPKEVLGNYQEALFDFGTFLIGDPEQNPERIKALSESTYIFDLSVNSAGQENNPYDALNAQLLGKTLQLGALADCISGIQLNSTKRGLEYLVTLENTNPEYDTPVNGSIRVQIVETEITTHQELLENNTANPMPFRTVDKDFQRLLDLTNDNPYSLTINQPAQGTTPELIVTLTYGVDYFGLSLETATTHEVVDGFIAKVLEDGSVAQAQFAPVDKDKPELGNAFQQVGVITLDQLAELGLSSGYDLLEVIAISNTGGIGYLKNRPDFAPLGSLFTSALSPDVFKDMPPVFIIQDKFGYLGINEYLDYTSGMMPVSFTDPHQIAGSLVFWDEGSKSTIQDDKVRTGMIQNNLLGGWMQLDYTNFGVENKVLELYNGLKPTEPQPTPAQ